MDQTHRLIAFKFRQSEPPLIHTFCKSYAGLKAELRTVCALQGYSHWAIFGRYNGRLHGVGVLAWYERYFTDDEIVELARQELPKYQQLDAKRKADIAAGYTDIRRMLVGGKVS